ncbi:hypothetical protein TL16_g09072 [Triparma laevis f. inornata]|uniref:Uncharacterized protein n=1 Tax=Triparma laevis f. inornata TaxID=1714386 RepID=A0A9W7B694_9STRA|nr:hypothetical protein TL16_g09072 [Triparma laevis f. inornata]
MSAPSSKISEIDAELSSIASEKESLLLQIRNLTTRQTDLQNERQTHAKKIEDVREKFEENFKVLDGRCEGAGRVKRVCDAVLEITEIFSQVGESLESASKQTATSTSPKKPPNSKLSDLVHRVHIYLSTEYACVSHIQTRIEADTTKVRNEEGEI